MGVHAMVSLMGGAHPTVIVAIPPVAWVALLTVASGQGQQSEHMILALLQAAMTLHPQGTRVSDRPRWGT